MKRALALIAALSCTAAHGQHVQPGRNGGGVTEETRARVERWSLCQREFVTPLLETQRTVPEVVSGAHEACRSDEEALRRALVTAHGQAQADALMAIMKEQTDVIMCGLLRAVRQRRDGAQEGSMTFNTAAECLRGDVRVAPGNRGS